MPREIVILACDVCKRHNYRTDRNKRRNKDRYQLKKYCKYCRKHTLHKEIR